MCKYMTEKMTGFCKVEYRDKWGGKHIIITTEANLINLSHLTAGIPLYEKNGLTGRKQYC